MDSIHIEGGNQLNGSIPVSGAKNAALPLMIACLLTSEPLILSRVPKLADIETLSSLLADLGVKIYKKTDKNTSATLTLNSARVNNTTARYDLVRRMRASILVLGPLLARFGHADVSLPGGCAIGTRPIDIHLEGLKQMGAAISLNGGYIKARAPNGLKGIKYRLKSPSVGATENLLMAATLARGETELLNVACEPEIEDLANCLVKMGSRIHGIGTQTLNIEGQYNLSGTNFAVMADRIEAGTYAIAAAITGGAIEIIGAKPQHLDSLFTKLREAGVIIKETSNGIKVTSSGSLSTLNITTGPYPHFPTDLQAQIMVLMSMAKGRSELTETVFENRFMHVPELMRMGADIQLQGRTAIINGVKALRGAPVMATDLRASSSLVLAGLGAIGDTTVTRVYHLDRGYDQIEKKLEALGAKIKRLRE